MLLDNPALQMLKKQFDSEKVKKEGIVRASERGFGFLEVANDKTSYFIPPQAMKNVLNGDRVIAIITEEEERPAKKGAAQGGDKNAKGDKGKRCQAAPESLVEAALKEHFVGRVAFVNGKMNVVPDNPTIKQTFICDDHRKDKSVKLQEGDWIQCHLTKHALKDGSFRAEILEEITNSGDPATPWVVSLRTLDLPVAPPDSDSEYPFLERDLEREDMTSLPFVTIDSEKTEDMDDALYIEKCDDGFRLFVAIADPTGYIAEDSKLDIEAASRAFSIYLPGRNIPMLPRELSDNLCSLREGELRPALVGIVHILQDGTIVTEDTEFKLAYIKSAGKLIYNYVSDFIENGDTTNFNPSAEVKRVLEDLVEMTKVRDHYRSTVLASFRTRPDYEFILNEEGALDHIEINERRIANQIVEESMISANIACGDFLAENLNTGIFNAHSGFSSDYIEDAVELLGNYNFKTTSEELQTISGFCAARRFANSMPTTYLDNMLRKYQEFSQMTINPMPHFALGVENYATWTSPIRKYGDMINHRLIKNVICDQAHPQMPDEELLSTMNIARRTNRMAERSVREWLYVDYLSDDVNKKTVFTAELFDVVRGGLRLVLQENGAFIFIPNSLFSGVRDDLEFDMVLGRVIYKKEPILYLGDTLKVRLVNVDKITRSIVGTPVELPNDLPLPNIEEIMQRRREQAARAARMPNNNRNGNAGNGNAGNANANAASVSVSDANAGSANA